MSSCNMKSAATTSYTFLPVMDRSSSLVVGVKW